MQKANAFNFSLSAPDELLGDEGYTMNILSDRINVASESTVGNMYGMQSILQMYKSIQMHFRLEQCGTIQDFQQEDLFWTLHVNQSPWTCSKKSQEPCVTIK